MWDIGVDVVEVQRFRRLDYPNHKRFYNRIFTPREIDYCLSFKNAAQHFAATFAGKESVFKAVNRHIRVKPREIEILRDGDAPQVNLVRGRVGMVDTGSQVEVKVSLSHTQSYAIAFALARFEKAGQT